MRYAKPFFDLQLRFAERVTEISSLPLAEVLLEYTNLYIRFGLGREFQPANPVWLDYLSGLQHGSDIRDWTYRFYQSRTEKLSGPPVVATFGCFSYALLSGDRIRLHFQNADSEDHSPLSSACQHQRRGDLRALFRHVSRTQPPGTHVVGVSWLYNLEAYRRLFPDSYIATASVLRDRFQFMPLWGQFLDRQGDIRESMAQILFERLHRLDSIEYLDACFPLQVLTVQAPVAEFYTHYGI